MKHGDLFSGVWKSGVEDAVLRILDGYFEDDFARHALHVLRLGTNPSEQRDSNPVTIMIEVQEEIHERDWLGAKEQIKHVLKDAGREDVQTMFARNEMAGTPHYD